MNREIIEQLAPKGSLRAGINMANFLLVTSRGQHGEPQGVAPDMANAIAKALGVPLVLVPYASPGELADAANAGVWDIGLIGNEPARAEKITFSAAYCEIEATYLVPPGSKFQHASEVDQSGVRIAVMARSAYDLWLVRNIKHAQLVHGETFDSTFEIFASQKLEAMASLRPGLLRDVEKMPGSKILNGQFTSVQQSVGTQKNKPQAAGFLRQFVEDTKASGMVAQWIEKHKVQGLSVAPPSKP